MRAHNETAPHTMRVRRWTRVPCRCSRTLILHVAVDEAQGAAPSDLSCFGGKAIAFVALEAVISVIGVDVDRRLLRLDRLDVAHRDVRVQPHRNAAWSGLSGTDRPS